MSDVKPAWDSKTRCYQHRGAAPGVSARGAVQEHSCPPVSGHSGQHHQKTPSLPPLLLYCPTSYHIKLFTSLVPDRHWPFGSCPESSIYFPYCHKSVKMACASPNSAAQGDMPAASAAGNASPRQAVVPKRVTFELLFTESQARGRLPMRVHIYPHDTTDSIVTTVKNFYGLYPGPNGGLGVSFEDQEGTTLIARYENFTHDMTVYVRVTEEPPATVTPYIAPPYKSSVSAAAYNEPGSNFTRQPAAYSGRDLSRSPRRRSPSPNGGARGRRSASANTNSHASKKGRPRSVKEPAADIYSDSMNGYSSGDGAPSSSSGRAKEQIGNTDISVENIVEGGRRKRAKFESSVCCRKSLSSFDIRPSILSTAFDLSSLIPRASDLTDCLVHAGTSAVCSAPNACGHFESIHIACSSCRAQSPLAAFRTTRS